MSLRAQMKGVATGELRVSDLLDHLLEQIGQREPSVNAFIFLDHDAVRAEAQRIDALPGGAAKGLIFAAKDNFDTVDMPTGYGSSLYTHNQPARDASSIALLRLEAGLLLGKTVSTEFAHVYPGKTSNPYNSAHTPGGSSSGSAAAVAAGMVPFAFGTQTTGSVIRPAAYCGIVGFKPTWGDVNFAGVMANSPSFDTVGLMANTVDDVTVVWQLLTGQTLAPLSMPALTNCRIGYCQTPWWDDVTAEAQASTDNAAAALSSAGAQVIDFDDLGAFDDIVQLQGQVSGFEFSRVMAHERLHSLDQLSADLRDGRMQTGLDTTHAEYTTARQRLDVARVRLDEAFDAVDFVLTPPGPGAAPEGLRRTGPATFNLPWTTLHTPCVTVPAFANDAGLPVGLQVVGKRYTDAATLGYADAVRAFFA